MIGKVFPYIPFISNRTRFSLKFMPSKSEPMKLAFAEVKAENSFLRFQSPFSLL